MKVIIIFYFLVSLSLTGYSQVGIGTTNPNPDSALEISSTNQGLLLPRIALLSTSQTTPLSAHVNGMMVYNTNTSGSGITAVSPGFYFNDGTKWIRFSDQQAINGVDKTDDEWINATGSIIVGKLSNGITARPAGSEFVVKDDGNVGIGLTTPSDKLTLMVEDQMGIRLTGGNHITRTITFADLANGGQGEINWRKSTPGGAFSASIRTVGSDSWAVKGLGFFTGRFSDLTTNAIERMRITPDGKIGIGTTNPNTSSILDVTSSNAGILIPRVALLSTTDVTTISAPVTSLMVYNTNSVSDVLPGYFYWNGTQWLQIATTAMIKNKWDFAGNSGTNSSIHFVGTTDNQDLVFRRNNSLAGRLGVKNTAFGLNALSAIPANTNWVENTAIGIDVLKNNVSGYGNTGVGHGVLTTNNSNNNTAIGRYAMEDNVNGFNNTSAGAYSLQMNTSGTHNTAIGLNALKNNTTGGYNTAIGYNALVNNVGSQENTALGYGTLENNTGHNNTATGTRALQENTSGTYNTANGRYALNQNTSGTENTGVGATALASNTTGNRNTTTGMQSLNANSTGSQNTANGTRALHENITGSNNSAMGNEALRYNTTGAGNVAIGGSALNVNTTGGNNTGIGYLSNVTVANLTNATAIGYNASVGASNSLVLGSISPAVKVGIGVTAPTNSLHIVSTSNPLRIEGLQNASVSESFLTVDGSGVVHKSSTTLSGVDTSGDEWINTSGSVELGKQSDGVTNRPAGTEFVALDNGNVGIGLSNPSAKLEVRSTTANTSGLKLTRLTSSSPVATGATLGVDGIGNVVTVPGAAPVVIYTGSLGNGSGGSVNATITASGFNTVPLPNTSTNIGGGIWNGTNNTYTIPVSGTYLIKSSIRLTDGSVSRNVFQAVHTSNADIPDGIWQTNSGTRWTMLYTRIAYFNQGDILRLYIYSDGQPGRLSDASLNITLLSKN